MEDYTSHFFLEAAYKVTISSNAENSSRRDKLNDDAALALTFISSQVFS